VDIPECDDQAIGMLRDTFHLHPMEVQDCVQRNRVPKMHADADRVLVVLHAPEKGERGHVHFLELTLIVGANYLISVHGPVNPAVRPGAAQRETQAVLRRMNEGRLRPTSPVALAHGIVSALAGNQEQYIEAATGDAWELEQRLTGGQVGDPEGFLDDLFRVRHGLLAVRTMAALSSTIFSRVATLPALPADDVPPVRDVAERFERIRVVADDENEYLHGVIEFFQTTLVVKSALNAEAQNETISRLARASYDQNEQVKKISAWAAIFFAPTLIASIYGMNFTHMPELNWLLGYPFALAAMLLICLILHRAFKRIGWL
jgi:Mg2+ and Co2+ transporter CorA